MIDIHQTIKAGVESICPSCNHYLVCRATGNQPCAECNQYAPVAQHGKWVTHYRSGTTVAEGYVSTCCDMWNNRKCDFCPNCGARMDGRETDV